MRGHDTLLIFLLLLSGCVGPSYYLQSATGHMDLLMRREPVEELLADKALSVDLRDKLEQTRDLRQFAAATLLLPTKGTFTTYADLERPYATWVVFAAPALSLEPKTWCFPVTGWKSCKNKGLTPISAALRPIPPWAGSTALF